MKKRFILVFALVFVLALTGCNKGRTITGDTVSMDEKPEERTKSEDKTLVGAETSDITKSVEVTVSYANYTDEDVIYSGGLNADKMTIEGEYHFPIYKFESVQELRQFKKAFGEILTMDYGYDENPSFNEATAKYDEAFFKDNTLMLVYVTDGSGSVRFGVGSVTCDGKSFCIDVKQTNNPEVFTEDMAGWFITVAVADSVIANCTEFDAR